MSTNIDLKAAPGRPKDLEKRAAILEAAKTLFLARGFDGTSMDAVSAEAGVSKLTVYSHFGDKDTLFKSAVQSKCEQQMPETVFVVARGTPIREALSRFGLSFHELLHSTEAIELHRMMIASAGHSTHLAELFFEAGPKRTLEGLERLLRKAVADGELDISNPAMAANHLLVLFKGLDHMRHLIGCCQTPSKAQSREHIEGVVEFFMQAYQPR